jgi:excisionase family DNA binding protein
MNGINQITEDRLLRKREAAAMLACSVRTIERAASTGRLKLVRVLGGVRIRHSEIQAKINSNGL